VSIPVLLLLTATDAKGSVIYSYTGHAFTLLFVDGTTPPPRPYNSGDRVSGFLELAAPLAGNLSFAELTFLSFSFSDGVNTIASANSTDASFRFTTNAYGDIVGWTARADLAGDGSLRRIATVKDQYAGLIDFGRHESCGPGSLPPGCEADALWYDTGGAVVDMPGTWTLQVNSVPEPTSMILIGTAFSAVFAARRRRALHNTGW
jgi:hypothetical protein